MDVMAHARMEGGRGGRGICVLWGRKRGDCCDFLNLMNGKKDKALKATINYLSLICNDF